MKWSALLPLALSTISLLPSVGAWEVTWHDSDNKSHSRDGHGPSECIEIDNPKGKVFKIDSQDEKGINMLLFDNSECTGKSAGQATESFSKVASLDLLGFKVVSLSSSNSSETTTKDKSASHTTTTSSKVSNTQALSTSSSEGDKSVTAQTTAATTGATTSASETPSNASPTTSSAASATTSNAAMKVLGPSDNVAKGLMGGIMGLAMAQWII
ncbi:hypothetical protein N7533_005388 [Penicillium manginii]|jgi:hypothetical protein|uniref:uncharacterized protein n=1 Tax=Penicillium manginii TaxID=203109 RepID=UPI00254982E0|nr:uncharacterized protein N7533_005388 [Penicillium manginii]KAJ5755845.1 hypothetical protein N7533_005388 [Penicillium manginii]